MRCLWKLKGLLAVAVLGFACDAGGAERGATDAAEEESPRPAKVERAAKSATEPLPERSDQPPLLAQPESTSKPKAVSRKKTAPAVNTTPVSKTADGPALTRSSAAPPQSPTKQKSAAEATTIPVGSKAKSNTLPAEALPAQEKTTPEVHALPVQPAAAAKVSLPHSASLSAAGLPSAADLPARNPATRSPASRARVQPSTRKATESATESVVDAGALAATPTAAVRGTLNAATGTNRTGVQPASARRAARSAPVAKTSHSPSPDVAQDEPEVQNADYHELGPSTRYQMEPPDPIKRRSGGWRMAALQPAAPQGPVHSSPAQSGLAPSSAAPSVMEEIEGEMQGPMPGPVQGLIEGEPSADWLSEGDTDGECDDGSCAPARRWGVTGGFEALIVRPHFSDPQGLLATTATQGQNGSEISDNSLNYDFNYLGSFRMYAGLRNCACGDEFRFTYWNFGGRDTQRGVATTTTNYCDFVCNVTAQAGDRMSARVGLNLNVFDLDMIKPFYMGQQSCGGCGPSASGSGNCGSGNCGSDGGGDCESAACSSGGCGSGGCGSGGCGDKSCGVCCPVWDLRWLAGFRFASVNHGLDSQIITTGETVAAMGQSRATYFGVGPRIGLQGRRYFGSASRLSAYAKGTGSLLVGNYDQTLRNFNITPQPTNSISTSRATRVVPVAELEAGVSWRLSPRTVLTGGWLVQSWWDLGLQEITTGNDDANILGFDGFFARAEVVF